MSHFQKRQKLVIFDADGTTIDSFHAIEQTFKRHDMDIGELERFQRRRRVFKYLGGIKEFPKNLRKQFGNKNRKRLLNTLTDFYREEARLYPGIDTLLKTLLNAPNVRIGLVTRNVTIEPEYTLKCLFHRHGINLDDFDYFSCISLGMDKGEHFRRAREHFGINPALSYVCGDEYSDYRATIESAMYPFIVAYGAEDRLRLRKVFSVPAEVIHESPEQFASSLLHTLDLENLDVAIKQASIAK